MKASHNFVFALALATLVAGSFSACQPNSSVAGESRSDVKKVLRTDATPIERIVFGAIEQTSYTFSYDPSYVKIAYPMGDVPLDRGVCADVVVRAFRKAGIDLQEEIHKDMKSSFSAYPRKWGARRPDSNIDHRRVANLTTFFERKGKSIRVSSRPEEYKPGDVVAWELDTGLLHIGLVTDEKRSDSGPYLIVHNIGAGARLEDVLFSWKIIGHYRYF
jgi:uncharacterized protein YijF (DUF1287 family)